MKKEVRKVIMTNFKNHENGIEINVKSIQSDFNLEPSELGKHDQKLNLNPVNIKEVPKEQRDKLDSYIKQWKNPSKWYECRINGLEWFLRVAQKNNVNPEDVEFIIENDNENHPVIRPLLKNNRITSDKNISKLGDMDRLRKFLKLYPKYKTRVENGENVADIAISIIKKYTDEEEMRNIGLGN